MGRALAERRRSVKTDACFTWNIYQGHGLGAEYQEQAQPGQIHRGVHFAMPRSDWNILAPFAGLAALLIAFGLGSYVTATSDNPEQRYPSYRQSSEQTEGAQPLSAQIANPVQYRTPCHNSQGAGESDLCAQWRAAQAAEESAIWTKWGFFAGLIGLIGLWWQVVLTRRAVEDTGLATEEMRDANEIARDTAKRQLRAYVSVSDISLSPVGAHRPYGLQGSVTFINTGETPAIDLEAALWVAVSAGSFLDRMPIIEHPISNSPSKTVLGAGLPQQITHVTQITDHTAAEIMSGDFTVVVHGLIRYRDIFGQLQETRYRSFQNSKTRKTGTPIASCPDGNSIT